MARPRRIERARAAAERAVLAGQRIAELERRLHSLRGGESQIVDADVARAAYDQSAVLAAEGRQSAIVAFSRAAVAHRAAAEAARSRGDVERALQHLELARADDLSADALARTGD